MANIFKPFLTNRNPRNLELLRYAWKPTGYQLEKDKKLRSFYYKIYYEASARNTNAQLVHCKDGPVIWASTKEFAIRCRLHSCADVSASENIGRILAHRCLKAGVYYACKNLTDEEFKNASEKVKAFYHGLEDGGLLLEEPPTITPHWDIDKRYHMRVIEQENAQEENRQLNYLSTQSLQQNSDPKFLPFNNDP